MKGLSALYCLLIFTIIFNYVCVSMSRWMHMIPWIPEASDIPGVTGSSEPPNVGTGNQTQICTIAVFALNH